ncbi:amidohydrolase [Halocalculus aciditolerans]|uniref:Glutamate carboxypeptidase n=1 Tax=Halocalculus aciditolerans TaxID=1383812 RepID=A0A830FKY3_9EURY|nr:amidohydrolase [Halocalculus aciditolerans]GGL66189.1 glutamate carboxypeptidase [Halocalculus aciditolerans]
MTKDIIHERIEARRTELVALTRSIWENPELGLEETESAELLADRLAADGFSVERGVGGMETAFVASYGEGDPTIGILGEYDALPGLSQTVSTTREPVEEGGPGHGCGHNLFGVGSLGAAIAVKDAIEADELDGTIRYYGCPAEETLVGKVYMARAGVFDDLDAALTWHPSHVSAPWKGRSLAMNSIEYQFDGQSAHAADSPESGRSSLDAIELMNMGAEFMREHVSDAARIHYTITDGGGAPNVVPAEASVWYFVRAPSRKEVERITAWLDDVAEGATLMTQTSFERRFLTGCYDYMASDTLSDVLLANMRELGSIDYSDADREFAAGLKQTLSDETVESRLSDLPEGRREAAAGRALYSEPMESFDEGTVMSGSTDVADVSWITPVAQFWGASWPVGTPSHSWQAVAANGDFGAKSAIYAAKVLGGTAYDLFDDPSLLEAAAAELEERRPHQYVSPLPESAEPPTDVDVN